MPEAGTPGGGFCFALTGLDVFLGMCFQAFSLGCYIAGFQPGFWARLMAIAGVLVKSNALVGKRRRARRSEPDMRRALLLFAAVRRFF